MQALGLIETNGLIAAIESSDVMLKTSEVSLINREFVGGGLVTISVCVDVGAVKTAVDAGASAVDQLGENLLVSKHVIARPDSEIDKIVKNKKDTDTSVESSQEVNDQQVDNSEKTNSKLAELESKRINELRTMLKNKSAKISDADIQKMSKKQIITEILNADKEG